MVENGKIYKFTNLIDGKIYIGQTKQTLEQRLAKHKTQLNDNTYFHRALKKYGLENFSYELVEENIPFDQLNNREIFWIKFFDSYYVSGKGYNMTLGGQWSSSLYKITPSEADEIKKLISSTGLTFEEIGKKFGVTLYCISDINRGKSFHEDTLKYPLREAPERSLLNEEKIDLIINFLQNSDLNMTDIGLTLNVKPFTVGEINRGTNSWCPKDLSYPIRKSIKANTYNNILNEEKVIAIIRELCFTSTPLSDIGKNNGVAKNTIGDISRGVSWKEITKQFVCPIRKNKLKNQEIYRSIYGIV